jgi:hypothetical protein
LVRRVIHDTRCLIREELLLARTEIAENTKRIGRDAAAAVAGGFVAYAGFIVLIAGLGFLIAWAITTAGLSLLLAGFLGLLAAGLLTASVGGLVLLAAVKRLRQRSLAPQRALDTVRQWKGETPKEMVIAKEAPVEPVSARERHRRALTLEDRLQLTLRALRHRLSPSEAKARLTHQLSERRYVASAAAMGAGFLGMWFLRRRRPQH